MTDFCRIFDLHIMNGRLYDDVDGNFTCAANDGASTVDYNISNTDLFKKCSYFSIENRTESDHFPIFCQFTFDIVLNQSNVNTRNYLRTHDQIKYKWIPEKSENFILAFCDLLTINKDFIVQTCINNIDSGINKINDIFYRAAFSMKGCGRSRYSRTQTQPSWWDDECDRLKRTKYAALQKFRLTYNQGDLQSYKDSRNSFKNICKLKKNHFLSRERQKLIEVRSNPKKFWERLRRVDKKERSNPNITPNEWLNYFKSLLFDERQTGPINEQDNTGSWEETDQLNLPITQDEVISSINKQLSGKSPGPDGLCIELFKNVATEIAPILTRIFNIVFVKGVFPKTWGESIICPIHKSGTVHDPGNYRGISLLNTMYKIMSKIISTRLYNWAEENGKIDEGQAGFRKGYSTVDNIFTLQAMVQKYLSRPGAFLLCLH